MGPPHIFDPPGPVALSFTSDLSLSHGSFLLRFLLFSSPALFAVGPDWFWSALLFEVIRVPFFYTLPIYLLFGSGPFWVAYSDSAFLIGWLAVVLLLRVASARPACYREQRQQ
jgi:hypothetical protein